MLLNLQYIISDFQQYLLKAFWRVPRFFIFIAGVCWGQGSWGWILWGSFFGYFLLVPPNLKEVQAQISLICKIGNILQNNPKSILKCDNSIKVHVGLISFFGVYGVSLTEHITPADYNLLDLLLMVCLFEPTVLLVCFQHPIYTF